MTNRVGLAIVLLGAALLVTSSVAVSSVAIERSVAIEVVEDESALVGIEAHEPTVPAENTSPVDLVTVTNHAGTSLEVTAAESGATDSSGDVHAPDSIDPGESAAVTATVTCQDVPDAVDVTATGDGVTVERTVDVRAGCET